MEMTTLNCNPMWMTESTDDYQKYFSGNHLEIQPKSKDRSMCERFHLKGHYFSNCINVVTYPSLSEIPSDTSLAYNQYCIKYRQDFQRGLRCQVYSSQISPSQQAPNVKILQLEPTSPSYLSHAHLP